MMEVNNSANAVRQLIDFVKSDFEKVVLLKGTHQYAKHSLVMDLIRSYPGFKTGLFRTNSLQNVPTFLEQAGYERLLGKRFAAGKPYNLGGTFYYFDSLFTKSTWGKSPTGLDFALIYPMDSFCERKPADKNELLENILTWKTIKKIFIITWTDVRYDYTWLNDYVDRTIIYDVKEENPEYHQRVLDSQNNRF